MNAKAFFRFMIERERIRLKKEAGEPWPWTKDPILQMYKFTNVKRHHDRTSRQLITELYTPHYNAPEEQLLMNAAVFRYFGTIEFARAIGWQKKFDPERTAAVAMRRMENDERVFTGAYIVTSGNTKGPKPITVCKYLSSLDAHKKKIIRDIRDLHSWRVVISYMKHHVDGFGGQGFMAKEVILDTMYTSLWGEKGVVDRNDWTPIGPGSMRGASRLLEREPRERKGRLKMVKASPEETLDVCRKLFALVPKYWPKDFVELELHDIQFQLCEYDKYERVRLGQGKPRSRYEPPSGR